MHTRSVKKFIRDPFWTTDKTHVFRFALLPLTEMTIFFLFLLEIGTLEMGRF